LFGCSGSDCQVVSKHDVLMVFPVPVEWIKRRGQRNLRLRVKLDKIVLSAPYRCSERDMRALVEERQDWVRKAHADLVRKESGWPTELLSLHDSILLRGDWTRIEVPLGLTGPRKCTCEESTEVLVLILHPT